MSLQPQETGATDGIDLPTVCILCSHNCGIRVDVSNGALRAVRADPTDPATRGYFCHKALSLPHYVAHAERLRFPLKRTASGFVGIGWDQAIAEIALSLRSLRQAHSPRSIALVGVGVQGNHLDWAYALGFLKALGSPWWFNAMAQEKTQHALIDRWMLKAPPTVYLHSDGERSEYLLVMGTNPLLSHRGRNPRDLLRQMHADPSRTLVVVDPRRTQTARLADLHLRVRPGGDAYLLLGVLAEIVRQELYDADFIRRRTRGSARLAARLRAIDPGEMAARAGIDREDLRGVASGFATADTAAVFWDLGVEQVPNSTLISYLIRVLLTLTGNLGSRGGNTFHSMFAPAYGPLLERNPYRAPVSGIQAIPAFGPFGMFSPNLLPEEIERDHRERIRAVIVEGANPLVNYSDSARYREAFDKLDLLVVIDPALTETARRAHYVLPTPVAYEKWEWSGFPKGYPEIFARIRPPVVAAPAEALPEAEIYARLVESLGIVPRPPRRLRRAAGTTRPDATRDRATRDRAGDLGYLATILIRAVVSSRAALGGTFARVLFWTYRTAGIRLPAPALASLWLTCHFVALTRRRDVLRSLGRQRRWCSPPRLGAQLFRKLLDNPQGVEVARLDPSRNLRQHCGFWDGRVRLAPRPLLRELERVLEDPPREDAEYPLLLFSGERRRWTANTILRNPAWRRGEGSHCTLRMNSEDARAAGVGSGDGTEDRVRLETRRGTVEIPLELDDRLPPGLVSAPNGFGTFYPDETTGELQAVGVNINSLTDAADRDPFTGIPFHKHVPCRVTRAGGGVGSSSGL